MSSGGLMCVAPMPNHTRLENEACIIEAIRRRRPVPMPRKSLSMQFNNDFVRQTAAYPFLRDEKRAVGFIDAHAGAERRRCDGVDIAGERRRQRQSLYVLIEQELSADAKGARDDVSKLATNKLQEPISDGVEVRQQQPPTPPLHSSLDGAGIGANNDRIDEDGGAHDDRLCSVVDEQRSRLVRDPVFVVCSQNVVVESAFVAPTATIIENDSLATKTKEARPDDDDVLSPSPVSSASPPHESCVERMAVSSNKALLFEDVQTTKTQNEVATSDDSSLCVGAGDAVSATLASKRDSWGERKRNDVCDLRSAEAVSNNIHDAASSIVSINPADDAERHHESKSCDLTSQVEQETGGKQSSSSSFIGSTVAVDAGAADSDTQHDEFADVTIVARKKITSTSVVRSHSTVSVLTIKVAHESSMSGSVAIDDDETKDVIEERRKNKITRRRQTLPPPPTIHRQSTGAPENVSPPPPVFFNLAMPKVCPERLHNACTTRKRSPVAVITDYITMLAEHEHETIFGATIRRFVECSLSSSERDPHVVLQRIRQFLSGLKNYLLKSGEEELHTIIGEQSERLHANEFLNVDAIVDDALTGIVLNEFAQTPEHFDALHFDADSSTDEKVRCLLDQMQQQHLPLKKLELLHKAVELTMSAAASSDDNRFASKPSSTSFAAASFHHSLLYPNTEDLVRSFVHIFSRNPHVNCELEASYMWELLPQQVLSTVGNSLFFLSALFAAIHIMKTCPKSLDQLFALSNQNASAKSQSSAQTAIGETDAASSAFITVAIPNETAGTIDYHTFPAFLKISAAKLCRIVATRFAFVNPGDFGLYILREGMETQLKPEDTPSLIRDELCAKGTRHLFAYKRNGMRIVWPQLHAHGLSEKSEHVFSPNANRRRWV